MVGFFVIAVAVGLSIGALIARWWGVVVAVLLPLPLYLGVAIGWGNGFGENWQYTIPLWVIPAALGSIVGAMVRNARQAR